MPGCTFFRVPKSDKYRSKGLRWGCLRCYNLQRSKPKDLLNFAEQQGILSSAITAVSNPLVETLTPNAAVISPKTAYIRQQAGYIKRLETDVNVAHSDIDRVKQKLDFTSTHASELQDEIHHLREAQDEVKEAKEQLKDTEHHAATLQRRVDELEENATLMSQRRETEQQRKARLQEYISKLQRQLASTKAQHTNLVIRQRQERQALENDIEKLEEEINILKEQTKPGRRGRKAKRPEHQRYKWATEFYIEVVQPRKWTPLEIKHFIVGICKSDKCNVSFQDVMDCYFDSDSHDVKKSCEVGALKKYLSRRPPDTLQSYLATDTKFDKHIPEEMRRRLIQSWVAKVSYDITLNTLYINNINLGPTLLEPSPLRVYQR